MPCHVLLRFTFYVVAFHPPSCPPSSQVDASGKVKRSLHRIPTDEHMTLPPHLGGKMLFVSGL